MKVVFLAGPYRAARGRTVKENLVNARSVAVALWELGYAVICPHLNTSHFELDCTVPVESYLQGDLAILGKCDLVVMMPNWRESIGATGEYNEAVRLGKLILTWPRVPHSEELEEESRVMGYVIQQGG